MDQLGFWERDGQPPIQFWLDPFWARHYHGRGESLIFVPDRHYLSPMMHPASADQIDAYLREIIGQWFHGKVWRAEASPTRPIYLFDPDLAGPGHLTIAVLNLDQFVPLTQKLDWLNANLHLRVARLRGEEILQQLDAAMTAEEIAQAHPVQRRHYPGRSRACATDERWPYCCCHRRADHDAW